MSPAAAMVMSMGPVVVVVEGVGLGGGGGGASVVVVVVSNPGMVVATTTVGGTVMVTPALPSKAGCVSSPGKNMSGAQRAIDREDGAQSFQRVSHVASL